MSPVLYGLNIFQDSDSQLWLYQTQFKTLKKKYSLEA
jgi:hypothetical protein